MAPRGTASWLMMTCRCVGPWHTSGPVATWAADTLAQTGFCCDLAQINLWQENKLSRFPETPTHLESGAFALDGREGKLMARRDANNARRGPNSGMPIHEMRMDAEAHCPRLP